MSNHERKTALRPRQGARDATLMQYGLAMLAAILFGCVAFMVLSGEAAALLDFDDLPQ